jgi:hypothetical protein
MHRRAGVLRQIGDAEQRIIEPDEIRAARMRRRARAALAAAKIARS